MPPEIAVREELVKQGLLRTDRTDDGLLAIYTYTDRCVHEKAWDKITLNSRGNIFNVQTGECVARPFSKFFNLNENDMSQTYRFDWQSPHQFFVKLDGWLGTLYRHDGKYKVASRGSFHSTGAIWGTQWIQDKRIALDEILNDWDTLVFEIIEPGHRIILDHGEARLVILAAFNRHNGIEIERSTVEWIGAYTGIPVVDSVSDMYFEKALEIQKTMTGTEGFVVRFQDGRRVKIKTDWYMNIARFLQKLSPISVWTAFKNQTLDAFRLSIPQEIIGTLDQIEIKIKEQYLAETRRAMAYCDAMIEQYGEDRKQIALNQKCSKHDPARAAVFCVIDKQWDRLRNIVLDSIYPKGNQYAEVDE